MFLLCLHLTPSCCCCLGLDRVEKPLQLARFQHIPTTRYWVKVSSPAPPSLGLRLLDSTSRNVALLWSVVPLLANPSCHRVKLSSCLYLHLTFIFVFVFVFVFVFTYLYLFAVGVNTRQTTSFEWKSDKKLSLASQFWVFNSWPPPLCIQVMSGQIAG